jgi:fatty acid desaturase
VLPLWWTLRAAFAPFALACPRLRNTYGRAFLQDRSGRNLSVTPELLRCAREDRWQLLGQTLVLGCSAAAGLPVVEYYLIPWMMAGVLNAHRVIVEHAWHENIDRSRETVLATTHDHDMGRLGNALMYPHHIGLHRAHHIFPGASFTHLPRLTAVLARDETKQAADRGRSPE